MGLLPGKEAPSIHAPQGSRASAFVGFTRPASAMGLKTAHKKSQHRKALALTILIATHARWTGIDSYF